jgi:hypothetical protein
MRLRSEKRLVDRYALAVIHSSVVEKAIRSRAVCIDDEYGLATGDGASPKFLGRVQPW